MQFLYVTPKGIEPGSAVMCRGPVLDLGGEEPAGGTPAALRPRAVEGGGQLVLHPVLQATSLDHRKVSVRCWREERGEEGRGGSLGA